MNWWCSCRVPFSWRIAVAEIDSRKWHCVQIWHNGSSNWPFQIINFPDCLGINASINKEVLSEIQLVLLCRLFLMQAWYWEASIYAPASNLKPKFNTSKEMPALNLLQSYMEQAATDLNLAGIASNVISCLRNISLKSKKTYRNTAKDWQLTNSPLQNPHSVDWTLYKHHLGISFKSQL